MLRSRDGGEPGPPGGDASNTSFPRRRYRRTTAEASLAPAARRGRRPCPGPPIRRNGPARSERRVLAPPRDRTGEAPCHGRAKDCANDDVRGASWVWGTAE